MKSSRRILIASNPFVGHFLPLVPLAGQLRADGHEVLVATEPAFAPTVAQRDLPHAAVGRDLTLDDVLAAMPDILDVPPEDQDDYARPRMFVALRAHNILDDLARVLEEYRPDVVVRESAEFASWALAERAGLPHVAVGLSLRESAAYWRIADPWFGELGARVDRPDLDAGKLYRHCVATFAPAGYADWSDTPTVHAFRPAPLDDVGSGPVGDLGTDRPLVYATLGTEFYRADLMTTIIEAARAVGVTTIATTGSAHDPALVDPGSPDVTVARWIAQDAVLGRARAVVCHGGAGSVFGALRCGVPLVVVPQGADQFRHARRVEELGAGVAVAPSDQSAACIAGALTTVLEEPGYATAARRVARETAQLPGVDDAARLVAAVRAG
jgi:UDP:flavonoid glycosyltransferase YjiC (YdhE family)